MTFGFLALLGINFAAAIAHGIEHVERFRVLANDISYVNFALLGFASLFFEFFVLSRVRFLKSIGFDAFQNFPFRWVTALVFVAFLTFQLVNWLTRNEPKYWYAVIDYGASLVMMAAISIYVLAGVQSELKSSTRYKNYFFDNAFEVYTLLSVATVIVATVCLQSEFIYGLLHLDRYRFFTLVDIYHLALIPAFLCLLKARFSLTRALSACGHHADGHLEFNPNLVSPRSS